MKENIGVFSQVLDNQLSIDNTYRSCKSLLVKQGSCLTLFVKKYFITGLATCGIGTVLFIAILLFFQQLAEYGW